MKKTLALVFSVISVSAMAADIAPSPSNLQYSCVYVDGKPAPKQVGEWLINPSACKEGVTYNLVPYSIQAFYDAKNASMTGYAYSIANQFGLTVLNYAGKAPIVTTGSGWVSTDQGSKTCANNCHFKLVD